MIQKLIVKAITPALVFTLSTIIVFSSLDSNGKEQLLLALISGYFGNLTPNAEELLKKLDDSDNKENTKRDRLM